MLEISTTGGASTCSLYGSENSLDTPTYLSAVSSAASSPNVSFYRRSALMASVNFSGTPTTAAPGATLRLGSLLAGANYFSGRVRGLYMWRRVLNTAEGEIRASFFLADAGVSAAA